MLEHLNPIPANPQRVVVMGAQGFVGGAIVERLARAGIPVLALSRDQIDLLSKEASHQLAGFLLPGDAFVAVSAIAPCKDSGMLVDNVVMARAMVRALVGSPVEHVINISSDAVYADDPIPLTENSPAAPTTIHGVMHLARELMFRSEVTAPLATMRPTLLYGARDPHNGYGPNRFRRLAQAGEEIVLFGEGEERRDHVLVDDLAELALLVLRHRTRGILNVASGQVATFRELAEFTAATYSNPAVAVRSSVRSGPMPHNGYRPFDNRSLLAAFNGFHFTPWREGLSRVKERAA